MCFKIIIVFCYKSTITFIVENMGQMVKYKKYENITLTAPWVLNTE